MIILSNLFNSNLFKKLLESFQNEFSIKQIEKNYLLMELFYACQHNSHAKILHIL